MTISYQKPFVFSVSVFLFSNINPKIKFTAKNWPDLCNVYSKVMVLNFSLRKYFVLFFAEFKLLMFHNNIVKISEKNEQAELVENLPPSYLPYISLHNLHVHPFFRWGKK